MITPKPKDALHKAQLYRLLIELLDDPYIASHVYFKGGTCAAMLGFLDRFSIDLDFDLKKGAAREIVHTRLLALFTKLQLQVQQKSETSLFYVLKYNASKNERNSLKLSIMEEVVGANSYELAYLSEIDRYAQCQTIATMFANKLVALTDRYDKNSTIAGRDVYDIHHFFLQGYSYNQAVITERTGQKSVDYLHKLVKFIEENITDEIITQDLNVLVPTQQFQLVRKVLKRETTMFLNDEITRLERN